ncbi:hypothetical protein AB0F72_31770 [Actinoplanes sp. NPDC023936]|uniref:hypothetical protein n=1 Tax=Actinoplanes sp. NPDC023936 TaxID=3154910 RepID=UPI0033D8C4B0
MRLMETVVTVALTVSVAGASYAAFIPEKLEGDVRAVAAAATCRTVDTAIVGYMSVNGVAPTSTTQLTDWVKGDISAYSIEDGVAAGPGC